MTSRPFQIPAHDRDISINIARWDELIRAVNDRLEQRRGFAIVTANLDHIVKLRSDPAFQEAYLRHDLRVADGNPVVWLSKLARRPVELIPGADMIRPLTSLAAERDVPVALIGTTDAALSAAADRLRAENPGLRVACTISPPMGFEPEGDAARAYIDEIAVSGARLVFIALGAPKQERLAAFALDHSAGLGFVSIGAGLDFIAGHQKRAPAWVRRLTLEWFWRFCTNPGRLAKRYLLCAIILPGLMLYALRQRRQS
ncbi:MAG: WecB/TagA/CpsF family glycosyltransferase [Pseudomonadota bacterium]